MNLNKDKRMLDILNKMNKKDIVIKEETEKKVDKEALKKEYDRLKQINERFLGVSPLMGVAGQTVNSISTTQDKVNPINTKIGITAKEAFEISIKRVLESGAPINNIGFYDEINWNLQRMGHASKNPLDIKSAINDLLKYGEIRNK